MNAERNFTPRLGAGGLPVLASYAELEAGAFRSAIDRWDRVVPEYSKILYSRVVGERESLFDVEVKGDWRFYARISTYRNYVSRELIRDKDWLRLRDDFTDSMYPDVINACESMFEREITLHEWLRRMALIVRDTHLALWLWGSGGYNTMDSTSLVVLMDTLRFQYDYLTSFGQAILAGNRPESPSGVFPFGKQRQHISLYTPRSMQRQGVINRSTLYVEAGTASGERGKVVSYRRFTDELPEYPGDGNQICRTRCRCHWRFNFNTSDRSFYHAFWRLNARAKHCNTCLGNVVRWNPITILRF